MGAKVAFATLIVVIGVLSASALGVECMAAFTPAPFCLVLGILLARRMSTSDIMFVFSVAFLVASILLAGLHPQPGPSWLPLAPMAIAAMMGLAVIEGPVAGPDPNQRTATSHMY